jgi:hypothetical protein
MEIKEEFGPGYQFSIIFGDFAEYYSWLEAVFVLSYH